MHDLEASDACRRPRYPTHVMATRHPRRAKPDLTAQARRAGVRLVRFLYTDNGGITRGKATHVDGLVQRLTDGIGLTVAMQAMNMLDQLQPVEGLGPVGEIRLVPDPQTFTVLPYAPHAAAMTTDMRTLEGAAGEAGPSAFLKRQIAASAAAGFSVRAAYECEFSLAVKRPDGGFAPLDQSLCFSTIGMTTAAPVMDDIVAALEAQRIPVEQYYPELGHGQQELSIGHAPALEAADRQGFYRETLRAAAHRHGLLASLAPKPFVDQAGNGAHIHWSLWDAAGRRPIMYDPKGRYGVSTLGYYFIAGVLEHLPALLALTCPSVNSYRRLQPHFWSSAYTAWGPGKPGGAVPIPPPFDSDRAGSTNAELKACDASANPYLALGGLLAAGLDGVARELEPGGPIRVGPANYTEADRAPRGIVRCPATLAQALDHLEGDPVLPGALGPLLARSF